MDHIKHILDRDPKAIRLEVKKGTILQRQGDLSDQGYLVISGLLKSYIIDSKGKEHILNFAAENWIIADIESQAFEQPAELFIDSIEDSELLVFNRLRYFRPDALVEAKEIKLLSRRIAVMQRRVLMLLSSSASERYAYFVKSYPDLPGRVPQHMIAAYLGITPQALSTIRGRLARSH